jgi:hypothetical protein
MARIKKFAGAVLTIRLDTGKGEPVERVFGVDASSTGVLAGEIANISGDTPGALVRSISNAVSMGRYSPPPELVEVEEEGKNPPPGDPTDGQDDGA